MTEKEKEKMIPLSVVDAHIIELLKQRDKNESGISIFTHTEALNAMVHELEEMKKEATFVQEPLEQKINARIAFLENPNRLITADLIQNELDARIIKELRKLLS